MVNIVQPQQAGLRSFIGHDRLPNGCLAFLVSDEANAPHLRPGDIAVIDPADREPQCGELFLIAWDSDRFAIVETWTKTMCVGCGPNGEYIDTVCWLVAGSNRPRSFEEASERLDRGGYMGWVNGPYATEGPRAGYLNGKLRGKVVGILEPAFVEPIRQIGGGMMAIRPISPEQMLAAIPSLPRPMLARLVDHMIDRLNEPDGYLEDEDNTHAEPINERDSVRQGRSSVCITYFRHAVRT